MEKQRVVFMPRTFFYKFRARRLFVGYTVYAGSVAGYMMFNFRALQSMNKFYIYPREITKCLTNISFNLLVFRIFLLFFYLMTQCSLTTCYKPFAGTYRRIKRNFRCGKDYDAMYMCIIYE